MEICTDPNFLQVFYIIKVAFKIVSIIVPLIVLFMIIKGAFIAVVNGKPDEELKALFSNSVKKLIAGLVVFLLPGLFNFIFTELVPEQTEFNVCFTNANLDSIQEYRTMSEEERKAEATQRKEALKTASKEREEKDAKDREKVLASKKEQEEETEVVGSSTTTGTSSKENMTLKTYTGSGKIKYWELVPEGISKHPALIIFLHGSGECGSPNAMLHAGMTKFMYNGSMDGYDAIFIAPNTAGCSWTTDAQTVKQLIDYVVEEYNVDKDHIIITGHSLGGNGTWTMVAKHPQFFSAAVPVSGCPVHSKDSYIHTPIRSYVGASEGSYYKVCNNSYVPAINNLGGDVELIYTNSPNDTHGSVINVYGNSELINWMLSQ